MVAALRESVSTGSKASGVGINTSLPKLSNREGTEEEIPGLLTLPVL